MLDSKYRGRRLGVAIRDGSVRQARKKAGLSLAQVAAGEVSRTAILYIETGRTKPSMETLRLISRQTRFPINYFLLVPESGARYSELPDELIQLERLIATRDFEAVLVLAKELMEQPTSADDAALVRFQLGQAYCRLVWPEEALPHLTSARQHFERCGDEAMAVEALDWEAAALGLLEDPMALRLTEEALERCRKLDPKPALTEARILGHIANLHVVAHSWAQAARYYESAVEAAGAVKDMLLEAKMHHGLGAVYERMLKPTEARRHFERALALYGIESDPSALYRVENDLGFFLLRQGQLDSAEQHLLAALGGSEEVKLDRRGRGFTLNNLAHLSLLTGDLQAARRYMNQALDCGEATGENLVRAEAHTLFGQLAEREGDRRAADEEFGIAIGILETVGMPDRLRDLHIDYATLLDARHDTEASVRHWRQAAQLGKLDTAGLALSGAAKRARSRADAH
ncbi:MAG TPA: tetratricopeptide repeat protein [Candidatus Baltobacterales bacterium]|nr:tetratricopeptide repeat protein [Candidatus Baltobacterales bacterium]